MPIGYNNPTVRTIEVWFHGYNYNVTPASRTAISDTISNGHAFCFDPEAWTDGSFVTSPPGDGTVPHPASFAKYRQATFGASSDTVRLQGGSGNKSGYLSNVTKPATGILGLFAGVVVGLDANGITRTTGGMNNNGYQEGAWLTLACNAEVVDALVLGNMSTNGYETLLGPVNNQWYLGIVTPEEHIAGKPMIRDNVASAAVHPVTLSNQVGVWGGRH